MLESCRFPASSQFGVIDGQKHLGHQTFQGQNETILGTDSYSGVNQKPTSKATFPIHNLKSKVDDTA